MLYAASVADEEEDEQGPAQRGSHSPFAESVLSLPSGRGDAPISESFVATKTTPGLEPLSPTSGLESKEARADPPTETDAYRFYEILGEQGSGGLGRVYRARDVRLDRLVALKELIDSPRSREAEARFLREVLLSARLQHPSIITVYEVGRKPDGAPFYAMKLVEGRPLDEVIRSEASFEARLGLLPRVLAVFEAIAYAHEQGIIHRDLKPSNVIVGAFGETVVIDWGLAKDLKAPTSDDEPPRINAAPFGEIVDGTNIGRTAASAQMGTPAYMAPEQMAGAVDVDMATDIFALGGILYHLLAQRPPYGDDDEPHARVLERIASATPIPLEERVPRSKAPADLVAIVKKAMAPKREDRYASAKALASDLARYQKGQLVSAHQYSPRALVARFVRRHRGAVLATVAFLMVLGVVGGFSIHRVIVERDRAEARSLELTMMQARTMLEHDPSASIAWLKTYPTGGPEWSEVASIAAEAQRRGVSKYRLELFPTSWVRDLSLSADGRIAAACDEMQNVVAVDVKEGTIAHRFKHPGTARRVLVLPNNVIVAGGEDGKLVVLEGSRERTIDAGANGSPVRALAALSDREVVSAHKDGSVRATDVNTGTGRVIGRHEGTADRLAVSANWIASVGGDDKVRLWERKPTGASAGPVYALMAGPRRPRVIFMNGPSPKNVMALLQPTGTIEILQMDEARSTLARVAALTGHKVANEAIDLSPDNRWLASAGLDRVVRVWDLTDAAGTFRVLHGHQTEVVTVRFSPDGSKIASAGVDGEIRIWDARTLKDVRRLRGHPQSVEQLRWSSATVLVAADLGGFMRVWHLDDDPHRVLSGHAGDVVPMLWSRDGTHIATGSNDKTLRYFDVATGESKVWTDHTSSVRYLDLAGATLVSAGLDQQVRSNSIDGSRPNRVLHESARPISDLVATPDGEHVAVAKVGGDLTFLDMAADAGREITIEGAHKGTIQALASSDPSMIASGGDDRVVRLWDATLGSARATLEGHDSEVNRLAFSSDGKLLAAGTRGGTIKVWTVSTKTSITLAGHDKRVTTLAWSKDGLLASGAHDGVIKTWDVTTGKERSRAMHTQHVAVLRFSPDGRFLASGSQDQTVRIWDSRTLALRAMHAHDNVLTNVAFSPDGKTLASTGWDDVVRLWPVDEARMLPTQRDTLRKYLDTITTQTINR